MMGLSESKFSDLFLPAGIEEAWYKETPSALDRIPVAFTLADVIRKLRREMEGAMSGSPDFRIDFDGIRATIRTGDSYLLKSEAESPRRLYMSGELQ